MSRQAFVFVDLDERWMPLVDALRQRRLEIVAVQSRWRRNANALWKDIADREIVIADGADASELAKAFEAVGAPDRIAGILTDQDAVLLPVAQAARAIGVMFTDPKAVAVCRDKGQFREAIAGAGESPKFRRTLSMDSVREAVAEIGYPCIVKPARGSGSRICYPLYSDEHLNWYLDELKRVSPRLPRHMQWLLEGGLVCESWIDGQIVSVAVASSADGTALVSCALHLKHEENPCVGFGSVSFAPDLSGPLGECARFAERLVNWLGLDLGLFDVELVLTPAGPVALEINARPMGGEMMAALAMRASSDVFGYLIDLYSGHCPLPPSLCIGVEAGIYKIVARVGGQISAELDLDELQSLLPAHAVLRNYRLKAGTTVAALEVLGRVLLNGTGIPHRLAALDMQMAELSQIIGVELVIASPSVTAQLSMLPS